MNSTPEQRKEYKSRVEALGTLGSWARECRVSRKTVERQCSGYIKTIKHTFWIALDVKDGLGVPDLEE